MTFGDGTQRTVGSHVVHGQAGFLVISTDWIPSAGSPGPGAPRHSMWLSSDGAEWQQVAGHDVVEGIGVAALATAADGTFVLHGSRAIDGGYESVALRSSDGARWEEIETGLPQVIHVQAIAAGPTGYLLVGGQTGDTNPTLWLSADGLRWELVHEFDQTEQWVQIHDADGGEEGYVVLGRRIQLDGAYQRFSFASADGRNWVNRDEPFGADNQAYVFEASVSSLGPDWVATLGHPDAPTAAWFSADGLDWAEVGSIDAPGNTSSAVFDEVAGELLFSPGSLYWEGTPGVWASRDGAEWPRVDFGADVWLGGIATSDTMVVVAGTAPNEDFTSTGGVWVRPSE